VLAALASPPATKALDPDPFPRHSLRHAVYAALLHFGFETALSNPFNSNTTDYFVNLESGRCLDANLLFIGQNGTPIQLWDCLAGQNQGWNINFHIANSVALFETGKCLDANLGFIGQNGTPIQLWDCWGGQNQAWFFNSDGTITNRGDLEK
jgi:hypothetical protein